MKFPVPSRDCIVHPGLSFGTGQLVAKGKGSMYFRSFIVPACFFIASETFLSF
jgi:hypothetical protein